MKRTKKKKDLGWYYPLLPIDFTYERNSTYPIRNNSNLNRRDL